MIRWGEPWTRSGVSYTHKHTFLYDCKNRNTRSEGSTNCCEPRPRGQTNGGRASTGRGGGWKFNLPSKGGNRLSASGVLWLQKKLQLEGNHESARPYDSFTHHHHDYYCVFFFFLSFLFSFLSFEMFEYGHSWRSSPPSHQAKKLRRRSRFANASVSTWTLLMILRTLNRFSVVNS